MKTREELENAGNQILNSVRTELYLSMRFMGAALGSLDFRMDLSTRTLGTDAVSIRFNPLYLIKNFMERPELLNRAYMHMIMHCLFRHMFSAKEHEDAALWDLCCDIAAESVVDSMDYPTILRVSSDFRQEWYEKLESEVKVLTAEKIYHYFILKKRDPYLEESLRQEFSLCDHSFWEQMQDNNPDNEMNTGDMQSDSDAGAKNHMNENMDGNNRQDGSSSEEGEHKESKDATPLGSTNPKEDDWKDTAKRIESELETYSKDAAEDAGRLTWLLKLQNRRRKSYKEFLERFSVVREEVGVWTPLTTAFICTDLTFTGTCPLSRKTSSAR
jgi:predicted metal-dependent peptidase